MAPQVPLPDQLTAREPSPKPDLLPGVRFNTQAPIEAFGGGNEGVDKAVHGALDVADKYFEDQKSKADEMAVLDANRRASELKNQLMYGREGAIGKKGLDAAKAAEDYIPQFRQGVDDISSELTSDQRAMFAKMSQSHQIDFERDLNHHATIERNDYYDGVLKQGVSQAQDDAILRWNQPSGRFNPDTGKEERLPFNQDYIRQKLSEQDAYISSHAGANGRVSPEQVKNQIAVAHSQTHEKVLNAILDSGAPNKDTLAKQYFETNKDDITDGETLIKVTKSLRDATMLGEAQRSADSIYKNVGGDLLRADAEAQKIEDPKQRELTQKLIRDKSDLQRNYAEVQRTKNFKPAYDAVIKGGSVDQLPEATRNSLHPEDEQKLRKIEEDLRDGKLQQAGAPIAYDLRKKLADPQSGYEFASKLSLLKDYAGKMSPNQLEEIGKFQSTILHGGDRSEQDEFYNRTQVAEKTLGSMNITDKPSQDYVQLGLERAYRAEMKRGGGKKPDNDWIQKTTDTLARDAMRSGRAHQTFRKEPKAEQYNNPANNKVVSDEIGAAMLDKTLDSPRKVTPAIKQAIDSATGQAWEVVRDATGRGMSPDALRATVRMMSDSYTTQQRSLFGAPGTGIVGTIGDMLAKDVVKRGYEIGIHDVPKAFVDEITPKIIQAGRPATDKEVVYAYVRRLAGEKAKAK